MEFDIAVVQNWITSVAWPWIGSSGIKIVAIIIGAIVAQKLFNRFIDNIIRRTITGAPDLDETAEQKREDTLIGLFRGAMKIVIWVLVLLMILGEFNIDIGPLLAGAGIAGVALGFGAQYLVRDLINGFFIVFENQYRLGDVVCFGDTCGGVESINLRTTTIRDMDGTVHHVPNGEIKITSNLSKDFSRINLDIGIGYNTPLEKAIEIINAVGQELAQDEEWGPKIKEAPQFLRVNELADSAVVVKILGETKPLEQWGVTGELRKRLKIAFDQAGIEIPFPQQVVRYVGEKNPAA